MRPSRHPSTPPGERPAGRSADARGETGTDADDVGRRTRAPAGGADTGGIPVTADTGLGDAVGAPTAPDTPPAIDRGAVRQPPQRPQARDPQTRPATGETHPGATAPERLDGPLESLGKAVSAPVRPAADDLEAPDAPAPSGRDRGRGHKGA